MNQTVYFIKTDPLASEHGNIFRLVNNGVIASFIGVFGIVSNIINMIVFHKQGFTTTVNISFFALALSDLLCLITLEWFNVCLNPYLEIDAIPFVPMEFQYLTGGGCFHVCFSRCTSWITVYITAERCLSVSLPLKVKQIVSPRLTTFSMCTIFVIHVLMLLPEYSIAYLDWKFVPTRNRTLIGLVYRSFKNDVEGLVYTLTSVSGMLSFIAIIILTTFLTFRLGQKSNMHINTAMTNANSEARSLRDKKTMKMVVMIAAILIACYTPGTINSFATVFEPSFSLTGIYKNSFFAVWSVGYVCNAVNSSINILLYYKMSTKYRETFRLLFTKCIQPNKCNANIIRRRYR